MSVELACLFAGDAKKQRLLGDECSFVCAEKRRSDETGSESSCVRERDNKEQSVFFCFLGFFLP